MVDAVLAPALSRDVDAGRHADDDSGDLSRLHDDQVLSRSGCACAATPAPRALGLALLVGLLGLLRRRA